MPYESQVVNYVGLFLKYHIGLDYVHGYHMPIKIIIITYEYLSL